MAEPGAVTRVEVAGRTLALTSLDKLLYPATETTKSEILHYYACVGPILLRHLRNRPVTRVRWPHGVEGPSFFEKNLPSGAPTWLPRVRIDDVTYPLIADLADLTYLANLNSLEFHVPQWRITPDGVRGNPNRLVIDLDPGKPAGLRECAQVALHVRERLSALGLAVVPVTSGSKGMQLYAPLGGDLTSDQVRDLAQRLAAELTTRFPDLILWKMTKSLRPGKIFFDWSQNVAAKTTICPYSLRGRATPTHRAATANAANAARAPVPPLHSGAQRATPTVAFPRTWDEIERGATGKGALEQVMFEDALARLERDGDLLADVLID